MRKSFAIVVVALFMLPIMSCQGFFSAPVLSSITVSPATVSLQVNGTQQLSATGVNDDGSTTTLNNVTWSSSDTSKATVSNTGLVTAVANGNATITATSGTVSGTSQVSVGTASGVTVSPATKSLIVGQTFQFTASSGGSDVTSTANWTSSNDSIATFGLSTTKGLITAVTAGGPITVTATVNNVSGTATVTVTTQ